MDSPSKIILTVVIIATICTFASFSFIPPVSAASTVVKAEASATQLHIGDNLTVNIKLSNAQNIFGIDVTLTWNSTVLQLENVTPKLGVESHPNGVLHESAEYPIQTVDAEADQTTATYHISATSTGASTPTFSGDGTISTVTFRVTNTGSAGLALKNVELSQVSTDGDSFDLITPQTVVDSAQVAVPEFPVTIILAVMITAATVAILVSSKVLKKNSSPIKKAAF